MFIHVKLNMFLHCLKDRFVEPQIRISVTGFLRQGVAIQHNKIAVIPWMVNFLFGSLTKLLTYLFQISESVQEDSLRSSRAHLCTIVVSRAMGPSLRPTLRARTRAIRSAPTSSTAGRRRKSTCTSLASKLREFHRKFLLCRKL